MSASRRRPRSLFQPGMAAMWACTGASPVPFAICGLPPERRTGFAAFAGFPGVLPAIVLTPTEKALPRRGQERHEGAIAAKMTSLCTVLPESVKIGREQV